MKISIPDTLTFNGGYVDTAGFLAPQGLFTADVTGNFVTLGASLAHGSSGVVNKLLALPVFCIVVAPDVRSATWERCARLARSVCIFALGCGISAVVYAHLGTAVFIAPPLIAALAFLPPLRRMREASAA